MLSIDHRGAIVVDMGHLGEGIIRIDQNVLHEMINHLLAQQADVPVQKKRRVETLRAENEKSFTSGARFSRLCRGCRDPDPPERVVLTACGHAVCRACADAKAAYSLIVCTECNVHSHFNRLFEERAVAEAGEEEKEVADAPPAPFSRVCGVCYAPNPAARAVVKSCGHVACLACIEQLKNIDARVKCPFCRENSWAVPLVEQLLHEDDSEGGVWELPVHGVVGNDAAISPPSTRHFDDEVDDDDDSLLDNFENLLQTHIPSPAQSTHYENWPGPEGHSTIQSPARSPHNEAPAPSHKQPAAVECAENISAIVAQPVAAQNKLYEQAEDAHQEERARDAGSSLFCCFSRRGICG